MNFRLWLITYGLVAWLAAFGMLWMQYRPR
jgi:hypothetical protein